MHSDSKRLPLIKSEDQTLPREYLIVAIDDHSRELYAGIFPDPLPVCPGCGIFGGDPLRRGTLAAGHRNRNGKPTTH